MPAWNSSSLAVSENPMRHELRRNKFSGHIDNGLMRHSKQHMVEKKMFGKRFGRHGKDFSIGKRFNKKGKGVGDTKPYTAKGISPSVEEFDRMMENTAVEHNPNKKKSRFSKKFFG